MITTAFDQNDQSMVKYIVQKFHSNLEPIYISNMILLCIKEGFSEALKILLEYASDEDFEPVNSSSSAIMMWYGKDCVNVLLDDDRFSPNSCIKSYKCVDVPEDSQDTRMWKIDTKEDSIAKDPICKICVPFNFDPTPTEEEEVDVLCLYEVMYAVKDYESLSRLIQNPNFNTQSFIPEINPITPSLRWRYYSPLSERMQFICMLEKIIDEGNDELSGIILAREDLDINCSLGYKPHTLLLRAIRNRNIGLVRKLLEHPNMDVNKGHCIYSESLTSVIVACINGDFDIVKEIMEHHTFKWGLPTFTKDPQYFACPGQEYIYVSDIENIDEYIGNLIVIVLACYHGEIDALTDLFGDMIKPSSNNSNKKGLVLPQNIINGQKYPMYFHLLNLGWGTFMRYVISYLIARMWGFSTNHPLRHNIDEYMKFLALSQQNDKQYGEKAFHFMKCVIKSMDAYCHIPSCVKYFSDYIKLIDYETIKYYIRNYQALNYTYVIKNILVEALEENGYLDWNYCESPVERVVFDLSEFYKIPEKREPLKTNFFN